jgi:hypothetical protein
MVAGPGRQCPPPSHTSTPSSEAPAHCPGRQVVPEGNLRQAPLPSQLPSSPQVETLAAGQVAASRGATPTGTKLQVPTAPWTLQDLHVSVQADEQHTPSTQNPLVHSPSQPQAAPFALCPASPAAHDIASAPFRSVPASLAGPPDCP